MPHVGLLSHRIDLLVHRGVDSFVDLRFFFNDTATTEIYTLSYTTLFRSVEGGALRLLGEPELARARLEHGARVDRKSTRLNSSHTVISYAVFCLKKKKKRRTAGQS